MSDYSGGDLEIAPGRLLAGRYRLERLIGSGASAHVYAATDELLQLPVAIKILHDASDADRQIREATLAMTLSHPNIVAYHGAYSTDGRHFIVLEHCEGVSLATLLEAGPLPLEQVHSVLAGLASALAYAHEKGVLHRDISPANILITSGDEPTVKLIDFGIAKFSINAAAGTQTQNIGTPAFAAPEQLAGKPTTKSDLFGLGAVAFYMLTGHPPLIADQSVRGKLPGHIPARLADLIMSCLAVDPKKRPKSAAEVQLLLHRCAQSHLTRRGRTILSTALIVLLGIICAVPLAAPLNLLKLPAVGRIAAAVEQNFSFTFDNPQIIAQMAKLAIEHQDLPRIRELVLERVQSPSFRRQLFSEGSCIAAGAGAARSLRFLLQLGEPVSEACGRSPSDLMNQVYKSGSIESIDVLFEHINDLLPKVSATDPFGSAARRDDLTMFVTLLKHFESISPMPRVLTYPPLWSTKQLVRDERAADYRDAIRAVGPRVADIVDVDGNSSLHLAAKNGRPAALSLFLAIPGVDPHRLNDAGLTPVHTAIENTTEASRRRTLGVFGELKIDVNTPDRNGDPPLHYAIKRGALWAVEELLKSPTLNLATKDHSGKTALECARERNDAIGSQIRELLEARL